MDATTRTANLGDGENTMTDDKAHRHDLIEDYVTSMAHAIKLMDDMKEHMRHSMSNERDFWESLLIYETEPSEACRVDGMRLQCAREDLEAQMNRTRADIEKTISEMRREYVRMTEGEER